MLQWPNWQNQQQPGAPSHVSNGTAPNPLGQRPPQCYNNNNYFPQVNHTPVNHEFQRVSNFTMTPPPGAAAPGIKPEVTMTTLTSNPAKSYNTQMQLAEARLQTKFGEFTNPIAVMLDSASNRTYITSSLVKQVKPTKVGEELVSYSAFGGESASKPTIRSVYQLEILDREGHIINLYAIEIPQICQPINTVAISPEIMKSFSHLHLSNKYANSTVKIELLIGIDYY